MADYRIRLRTRKNEDFEVHPYDNEYIARFQFSKLAALEIEEIYLEENIDGKWEILESYGRK